MIDLEPVEAEEEVMRQLSNQGGDLESHGLVDVMGDMTKQDAERLHQLIARHAHYTNSARAKTILENWAAYQPKFKKVMPVEYRRALAEMAKHQAADPTRPGGDRDRHAGAEALTSRCADSAYGLRIVSPLDDETVVHEVFASTGSCNCRQVSAAADNHACVHVECRIAHAGRSLGRAISCRHRYDRNSPRMRCDARRICAQLGRRTCAASYWRIHSAPAR